MFEGEFISNNNTLSMVNTNAESFILHISETKRANQFKVFEKVRPQKFSSQWLKENLYFWEKLIYIKTSVKTMSKSTHNDVIELWLSYLQWSLENGIETHGWLKEPLTCNFPSYLGVRNFRAAEEVPYGDKAWRFQHQSGREGCCCN